MKNQITQFSKLLFATAAVVLFSFSVKAQDATTEVATTENNLEASAAEPNALLSASEVKQRTYAAESVTEPASEVANPKTLKRATKFVNTIKAVVAINKLNKMIKKAELKDPANSEKAKDGKQGGGLDQMMKAGILLALIGLVATVIGGVEGIGILWALGVICLVIGLVLIIIDLVNNM
jgi:hypothetical protein